METCKVDLVSQVESYSLVFRDNYEKKPKKILQTFVGIAKETGERKLYLSWNS